MEKREFFKDIEVEHRKNRLISLGLIVACVAIVGIVMYNANKMVEKATNKVYVLDNGKTLLAAFKMNADDNRPAEIRSHTKKLLNLLFTIGPDKTQIDQNNAEVLYLGDSSVFAIINNMKEARYYDRMIAASASSKLVFDTGAIKIDFSVYPYAVQVDCKNFIVRTSTIEERKLTCNLRLRNVPRSDNNPHGLIAENFIANSIIETSQQRN